jgi:heme-degrading monooxygenase HmoA
MASVSTESGTAGQPAGPATKPKLRVLFLVTVIDGAEQRFLDAYEAIRHEVARVPGHLADQVCQSTTDPAQWVITSEWLTADHFAVWESSASHRQLVAPMRDCLRDPNSMRFIVRKETT